MKLKEKYRNASKLTKLLVWLIPIRIFLSFYQYELLSPEMNIIEWLVRDAGAMILLYLSIPFLDYFYRYIKTSFSKFNVDSKTVPAAFIIPFILVTMITFIMTYSDFLQYDYLDDIQMFMNPYHMAVFADNIICYLKDITILDIPGDIFIGYCIALPIIILAVINVCNILHKLKTILFNTIDAKKNDKLHLVISSYLLILISMWAVFTSVIFTLPNIFDYARPTNPFVFILDTLYYSCSIWITGSSVIVPISSMSKIMVIMSMLCNTLFFVVFITGLFVEQDTKKEQKKADANVNNSKKPAANKTRKKKKK